MDHRWTLVVVRAAAEYKSRFKKEKRLVENEMLALFGDGR
jgi:hypothetical protein